ncbi:hypothetical protein SISSUDRAFT_1072364 [Sistotremastrum suecicum HHB10207 ss-3]|uniref:DUF4110 domain-containing protein n=1 Tax=Sistotremastrum suecicum HHB10207 ss-3 TaxID=1314776 RepID=A0A165YLW7_9AGAM|nr:hypothetical protein SISSUDRAFT_1072364 [Sistotremastrum suecicum HHB10207 ss-3]
MAKKKQPANKQNAKAAKKAKAAAKVEKKETKKIKSSTEEDSDDDLEGILDKFRREWESSHTVTEETVASPPSRRANATLTACPSGNHLWCIGGEYMSADGKAYFYNDVYRYTPEKNEWRKYSSPECPGPRSAHAVVASPQSGGLLFLFGGEFSSPSQTSFHHYRDFWSFSIATHEWTRIDNGGGGGGGRGKGKHVMPSARSGCRMAMYKHHVVLFGGFHDVGIRTTYLQDLWLFDTQEYRWHQVTFPPTTRVPSERSRARSGFSFLPHPHGLILHGGYTKEYPSSSGTKGIGKALDDTYLLSMSADPLHPTFTKIKIPASANNTPTPTRSGCTMAFWPRSSPSSSSSSSSTSSATSTSSGVGIGIMFGGVSDREIDEERIESVFWDELWGLRVDSAGNGGVGASGRWVRMGLKVSKKKKKGGASANVKKEDVEGNEVDPDDPLLTVPHARYNAMLAILKNTLYILAGIYELGSHEYTLDDFHAINLDKMDGYTCLWRGDVVGEILERVRERDGGAGDSSDEDDEDEGTDSEDSEDSEDGEDSEDDGDDGEEREGNEGEGGDALVDVEDAGDSDHEVAASISSSAKTKKAHKPTRKERKALALEALKLDTDYPATVAPSVPAGGGFETTSLPVAPPTENISNTPQPGESLAAFYARTCEHWAQRVLQNNDGTIGGAGEMKPTSGGGKMIRRDGFSMAEERYLEYKPTLEGIERILREAGLDDEDIKRGAGVGASIGPGGTVGGGLGGTTSRNRR